MCNQISLFILNLLISKLDVQIFSNFKILFFDFWWMRFSMHQEFLNLLRIWVIRLISFKWMYDLITYLFLPGYFKFTIQNYVNLFGFFSLWKYRLIPSKLLLNWQLPQLHGCQTVHFRESWDTLNEICQFLIIFFISLFEHF